MKTIVFASQKGGSSKSMLCRCQAVAAEKAGDGPVALIDTDPQGTTAKWWSRRPGDDTPMLLQVDFKRSSQGVLNVPAARREYEEALAAAQEAGLRYLFIDTQGALTDTLAIVGGGADFILIPVKASPDDIDAIPDTLAIVQQTGKPFAFILTQVKQQALITGAARLNVDQFGMICPVVMGDRVDYPGAVGDGRTVLETDPSSRSSGEMMELWDFLKDQLHKRSSGRKAKAA